MAHLNGKGPEEQGSKTGRGLGKCATASNQTTNEKLGTGLGTRRKSGGGEGKGKRLQSGLK
jgi:hypothetical protein